MTVKIARRQLRIYEVRISYAGRTYEESVDDALSGAQLSCKRS